MTDINALRDALIYEPDTGKFRWRHGVITGNGAVRMPPGAEAGTKTADGYIQVRFAGRCYRAHRLAWFYTHGTWPKCEIDHINGDGFDNRITNIRLANRSQNCANTRRRRTNKSGFKGVNWADHANKWAAFIRVGGKAKFLGYFDTPEVAHAAYVAAARKYHGEFARAA